MCTRASEKLRQGRTVAGCVEGEAPSEGAGPQYEMGERLACGINQCHSEDVRWLFILVVGEPQLSQ